VKLPLVLLLCFSISVFAQEEPEKTEAEKLAVYVFGASDAGINRAFGNKLLFAFAQNSKYAEIVNSEAFYSELAKSPDGGTGQVTQAAKNYGADVVCVVSITEVFGAYSISARLIKTSDSQVIEVASLDRSLKSLDDLTIVSNELASQLLGLPPPVVIAPPSPAKPKATKKPPKKSSKKTSKSVISDGNLIDRRDNKKYKIKVIGRQTWMAENLNYAYEDSKCYNDNPDNCDIYGRLYDWVAAMEACPAGWHVPSDEEWDVLINYAGGSSAAGRYLKAASGWNSGGNGTDRYGFSALPGGRGSSDGVFSSIGYGGRWWNASENYSNGAYHRHMHYSNDYVGLSYDGGSFLFSVRCLQD